MSFQLRSLAVAIATISTISMAHSAGLDRSGQNSSAFTEQGTFAYVDYVHIDPTVKGKDTSGNTVNDLAEEYSFVNYGFKTDLNKNLSVGIYYDQPWGASVEHSGNSNFITTNGNTRISELTGNRFTDLNTANATLNNLRTAIGGLRTQLASTTDSATQQALTTQITGLTTQATQLGSAIALANVAQADAGEVTKVKVESQNMTGLVGLKLGEKNNIHIYGGPAVQRTNAKVELRGSAYNAASGYDVYFSPSTEIGWVAGVGFSKPEIGLKASLTYRSEIEHDATTSEHFPVAPLRNLPTHTTTKSKIKTPESYNLDFQTGLNPTTLLTAKVRYVPWGDFKITPPLYNQMSGLNIINYRDDAWSGEIGLGKRLTPKLAVSGSVGYDSGAGNPATTLGPVKGFWNVGLGARYNITPEWSISGGAKYLKFGDATGQLPDGVTNVGDFSDNDGMIYGVRLAYHKK